MEETTRKQLVEQFVRRCIETSPKLVTKTNELIGLATLYLDNLDDTATASPSAESFGAMLFKLSKLGYDSLKEETLASADPENLDLINSQFASMAVQLETEIAAMTSAVVSDSAYTSDLERAAGYFSSYAVEKVGDRKAVSLYKEILETNPATIWDMFCVFPIVFMI